MMALWILYVTIVTALCISNGDLASSIFIALLFLIFLWPLALPLAFLIEIFKDIFKK